MRRAAVITGATGQDGSYLAELLVAHGDYDVYCIVRRTSYNPNRSNLREVLDKVKIYEADLMDQPSIMRVFEEVRNYERIEVYNLAAQSHVATSFKCPRSTVEINATGTLNILESIRQMNLVEKTRYYQASTSEMFGKVQEVPQKETTPFWPRSPYGVSKLCAHWLAINYRETYGMFVSCGILFNHESPRRGDMFVTQKIVKGIRDVIKGDLDCLEIGNLDSMRDWGHAKDYVKGMWLMIQQDTPDDFVLSSNEQHSVREFIERVFEDYKMEFTWQGTGTDEVCIVNGKVVVRVSPEFYRPCEVETLLGDSSKIRLLTGWTPEYDFLGLVRDMNSAVNK